MESRAWACMHTGVHVFSSVMEGDPAPCFPVCVCVVSLLPVKSMLTLQHNLDTVSFIQRKTGNQVGLGLFPLDQVVCLDQEY